MDGIEIECITMRALQWDYEVCFLLCAIVHHARLGPCEPNTVMLFVNG